MYFCSDILFTIIHEYRSFDGMQMKRHVLAPPSVLHKQIDSGRRGRGRHRPTSCWRACHIPQQSRHSTPSQHAVAFPAVLLRIDSVPARWLHQRVSGPLAAAPRASASPQAWS